MDLLDPYAQPTFSCMLVDDELVFEPYLGNFSEVILSDFVKIIN